MVDHSMRGAALLRVAQAVSAKYGGGAPVAGAAIVQREPIIPGDMAPALHIDANQASHYADYLAAYVATPIELVRAFRAQLSPDEVDSTLIAFSTLMGLLVRTYPAAQAAITAFNQAPAGPGKLAQLTAIAALIDTHLHQAVLDQQERDAEQQHQDASVEAPTASLEGPFLYIRFYNRPTRTRCEIRASLLRHGLWLMEESHPEVKNSVLLPEVQGELVADGADVGAQLVKAPEWHGAGKLYKASSGRVYEVDGPKHFFPVGGPGVVPLDRGQYLATRAVVELFHSDCGSMARKAANAQQLFELLEGQAPAEVATCVAQLQESGAKLPDVTVDQLIQEHVKAYGSASITETLARLGELLVEKREFDQARAQRDRRKAQEAHDRERMRNQPRTGQ